MEQDYVQGLKDKGLDSHLAKSLQIAHTLGRLNSNKIELAESVVRAMDTAEVGGGNEFVPTAFSPDVINQVRLELKVSSLFQHITMPSSVYKLPIEVGWRRWSLVLW